jgi:ketosteroid isomerase-like protein
MPQSFRLMNSTSPFARTPDECDRLFAAFVNAGDLDSLVQLYETNAQYVDRTGTVRSGHEEIRQALAPLAYSATSLDMHIVRMVETGGIAVVYNDWCVRTKVDGKVVERSGKAIEIVRQNPDGRWLFAIDDPFGRNRELV